MLVWLLMQKARHISTNVQGGISDRTQRIAFLGGLLGLVVNLTLFITYVYAGELNAYLVFNNTVYNLLLLAIIISSYKRLYFKEVALVCMLAIYAYAWGTSTYDEFTGNASIITLPVLMFSPIILLLIAGYRVLIGVAIFQSVAIYLHFKHFAIHSIGANWTTGEQTAFTSALAIISFVAVLMLAVVAYARGRNDKRMLALIGEKERLAAEDPLTGLINRRSFLARLDETWATGLPIACAFIDLDRFKPLNDEFGHAIGDNVLQTVATRLNELEDTIMAARFGGDEFAVLVEVAPLGKPLEAIFDEMHKHICADIVTEVGVVGVGASIGYAEALNDAADTSTLLHAADVAMLRVKDDGGGATRFNKDSDSHTLASDAIAATFRSALQGGNIRSALQPIADAKTGEIIGHELLARWINSGFPTDPSPNDFLPIAERHGLLGELLVTTLEQVFAAGMKSDLFLAVNISPSQLSNPKFFEPLLRLMKKYDIDPAQMELEITEQVAFRNPEHNIMMLEKARELGFSVALDDFGTGYSSLSMLDKLPLNKLKIDRSFLRKVDCDDSNDDVLSATINLAKKLGLTCCIEGVEEQAVIEHVLALGCDQVQGYWIGRPKLIEVASITAEPETPTTPRPLTPLRMVS